MKLATALLAGALIGLASPALGQHSSDTLIVMTVPLKHLSAKDAMQLLQPFVTTLPSDGKVGGGVFPLPNGAAITIREKVGNYARMLKLLRDYDRSAATVALTFQLIIADNSGTRDPEIAPLDTLLRRVLKFTGYKLLGVGVLRVGENTAAGETISGGGDKFGLQILVNEIRTTWSDGPRIIVDGVTQEPTGRQEGLVKLSVSLRKDGAESSAPALLSTGVSVPLGQTVVLGSAALDPRRAIILTVRPQLVSAAANGREN